MAIKKATGTNPLVSEQPVDTVDHCRAVLKWMRLIQDTVGGQEADFGRSLVLETVGSALDHVSAQLDAQMQAERPPRLEVVKA